MSFIWVKFYTFIRRFIPLCTWDSIEFSSTCQSSLSRFLVAVTVVRCVFWSHGSIASQFPVTWFSIKNVLAKENTWGVGVSHSQFYLLGWSLSSYSAEMKPRTVVLDTWWPKTKISKILWNKREKYTRRNLLNTTVFLDVVPGSVVQIDQSFRGACRLHRQAYET